MYLGFVLAAACLNTFGVRALPHVDRFAGVWGMVGIVVVCITLLACSSGEYQPAKSVFSEFTNLTGVGQCWSRVSTGRADTPSGLMESHSSSACCRAPWV